VLVPRLYHIRKVRTLELCGNIQPRYIVVMSVEGFIDIQDSAYRMHDPTDPHGSVGA
jgi:hypothetical protein